MTSETMLRRDTGISSKVLAIMSYLGVLSLVPLVVNRRDSYVLFHARQGVILWMWEVLAIYALLLPGVGKMFFRFSSMACLVLSVLGVAAVLLGRAWKFPLIGNWAEKL